MLQVAALRLAGLEHQAPMVICNEGHRFSVAEQFRGNKIVNSDIILEPVGRNTALAAFKSLQEGNDSFYWYLLLTM
jgi:mannose-1-phosphate guanylyltransferase